MCLYFRVVLWVVASEVLDSVAVHALETGSSIVHAVACHQRDHKREIANAETPGRWRTIGLMAWEEARANGYVGSALHYDLQQARDVFRVVLSIPIQSHQERVAVSPGELNPRLHCTTDPQVKREVEHTGPAAPGHPSRGIQGPIVDYQNVGKGCSYLDASNHVSDVFLLVIGRNDCQDRSMPVWIMRLPFPEASLSLVNPRGYLSRPG